MRTFIVALVAVAAVSAATVEKSPKLVSKGWTPKHKLGMCQGDCDATHHCKKGLICFTRGAAHAGSKAQAYSNNPYQTIPGCSGRGLSSMDYCVKPKQLSEFMKDRKKFMGKKWYKIQLASDKAWKIKMAKKRAHAHRLAAARRARAHKAAAAKRAHAHRMATARRNRAAAAKRAHAHRMAVARRNRAAAAKRAHAIEIAKLDAAKEQKKAEIAPAKSPVVTEPLPPSVPTLTEFLGKRANAKKAAAHRRRLAAEKRARANLKRQRAALRRRLAKTTVKAAPAAPCTTCNVGPHITMKSTTLVVKHI